MNPPVLGGFGVGATGPVVDVILRGAVLQLLLAGLLVLPVALAARLLRQRSGAVHHTLWSLVLLRLVLPPALAAPWSIALGLDVWLLGMGADGTGADGARHFPGGHFPGGHFPGGVPGPSFLDQAAWLPATVPADPAASLLATAAELVAASASSPFLLALVVAWGVGAAGSWARFLVARRRFRRLARGARTVEHPWVLSRATLWRRALGIRRPVRILVTPAPVAPYALGVLRPAVVLPRSLVDAASGAPAQRRAVDAALAHELGHVARRDDLHLRLQAVVTALWFFYPVARWAGRRLADARERAADERVLELGLLSPDAYARGLVAAARMSLSPFPTPSTAGGAVPALGSTARRLAMRLDHIASSPSLPRPRSFVSRLGVAAIALAGVLLLPLLGGGSIQAAGSSPPPAAPPAPVADATPELSHPLPTGRLTSSYGVRVWPMGGAGETFHRGIDLAARRGTDVVAPAAGTVLTARETLVQQPRLGTVVILDHGDGWTTHYAHLDATAVEEGATVAAGDVIGQVGSTGVSSGPHLHFEVRRDGEAVDPATVVDLDC